MAIVVVPDTPPQNGEFEEYTYRELVRIAEAQNTNIQNLEELVAALQTRIAALEP